MAKMLYELDGLYDDLLKSASNEPAEFERKLLDFISLVNRVKKKIELFSMVYSVGPIIDIASDPSDERNALVKVGLKMRRYKYESKPIKVRQFIVAEILPLTEAHLKSEDVIKAAVSRASKRELISPGEAARSLNVSYKTLWRWWKEGKIKAVRLPSGRLRYYRHEVEKLMKNAVG